MHPSSPEVRLKEMMNDSLSASRWADHCVALQYRSRMIPHPHRAMPDHICLVCYRQTAKEPVVHVNTDDSGGHLPGLTIARTMISDCRL
jgi:hypothetical protein